MKLSQHMPNVGMIIVVVSLICGFFLHDPICGLLANVKENEPEAGYAQVENFEMDDGAIYNGRLLNGERHGWGVLTVANGNSYEGEWYYNLLPYGTMKIWNANVNRFTKTWVGYFNQKMQAHGFGKMEYGKDSVYIGNYKNNCKEGLGRIWEKDGRQFFGRWKGGLKVKDDRLYATGDSVYGIDVSKWQKKGGPMDWDNLAIYCDRMGDVYTIRTDSTKYMHPVDFVFVKATRGADIQDEFYEEYVRLARQHYISMGSYHVLELGRTTESIALQMDNFLSTMQRTNHDLPPMLDLETDVLEKQQAQLKLDTVDVQDYIHKCLLAIEDAVCCKPIIYGSNDYLKAFIKSDSRFADYELWVARYPKEWSLKTNKKAKLYPELSEWSFWQMTNNANISGITHVVDIDKFNGSYKDFVKKYRTEKITE